MPLPIPIVGKLCTHNPPYALLLSVIVAIPTFISFSLSLPHNPKAGGAPNGGGNRGLRHREGRGEGVKASEPAKHGDGQQHRALRWFAEGGTDNFSKEIVVARLQQKLDKIERVFCSTMLNDTAQ